MKEDLLGLIEKSQDGIEAMSLISIASDQLHMEGTTISNLLAVLVSERKITSKDCNGTMRWIALENQKTDVSKYFEEIGGPHSQKGMATLNDFLIEHKEKVTILIDVTSVESFTNLSKRLERGLITEVILPPMSEINEERRKNYKHVRSDWIRFYKEHKKENFILLQSTVVNKAVRTTLFSEEKARINIRKMSALSTRDGCIVAVEKDNTLYKQFENEIKIQQYTADFCFDANPIKWIWNKILKSWLLILILISIMVLSIYEKNAVQEKTNESPAVFYATITNGPNIKGACLHS